MAWCQGLHWTEIWARTAWYIKEHTRTVLRSFMEECGIEACFPVRSATTRTIHRSMCRYADAGKNWRRRSPPSSWSAASLNSLPPGLMRDRYHYKQEGCNLVGAEAGKTPGFTWPPTADHSLITGRLRAHEHRNHRENLYFQI